jgi:hypothetical protein
MSMNPEDTHHEARDIRRARQRYPHRNEYWTLRIADALFDLRSGYGNTRCFGCRQQVAVERVYQCYYCGGVYCDRCGAEHFGASYD